MDKQELEKVERDILTDANSSLAASIEYLNGMLRYFDIDTRKFHGLATEWMAKVAEGGFKDGPEYTEWQIYERALIRALFAEIEGTTAAMRQIVLWAHERGEYTLSDIEHATLSEKHRYNTCKDNFTVAFKHFTLLFDSRYAVNKNSQEWNTFLRSIKVRDGLMHPKSPLGFQVSGDMAKDINETLHWFNQTYSDLIKSIPNARVSYI